MFGLLRLGVSVILFPIFAVLAIPIHGFLKLGGWCLGNCGWILAYIVGAPTAARVLYNTDKDKNKDAGSYAAGAVFTLVALGLAFCIPTMFHQGRAYYDPPAWFTTYHLDWVAFGLAITNAFSILYEIGRVWFRSVSGQSKREAEAEARNRKVEAIPTVDDFRSLLGDILDQLDIEPEEEKRYQERVSALKTGNQITINEEMLVRNLMKRKRSEADPVPSFFPDESRPDPDPGNA